MFDIVIENTSSIPPQKFIDNLEITCKTILEEFNKGQRTFSITLCDDEMIQKLNNQYRNKDYATDVLSFAMDDDSEFVFEFGSLGDIIVSTETAQKQAQEFEITYEEELARLIIHGLLHLLGFDHELGEEEHRIMFEYQDKFMDQFMISFSGHKSSKI